MTKKIAYQGEPGSNSHIACVQHCPDLEPMPCRTFDAVFEAVDSGQAELAMIPVENSIAGRVGDIYHLLPKSRLHIIGEMFQPIRFQLMAPKGAKLETIERAYSHLMALGQCGGFLKTHAITPRTSADTAGAARIVAERGDVTVAAIAPELAAEVYDLEILARDIEDAEHNTTRFVLMAREPLDIDPGDRRMVTAFLFQVRNIPAALYKAMGGFATNGVNMTKLESYMVGGSFTATQFYAEIDGHPDERRVQLALEELGFFSNSHRILGVFPAAEERLTRASPPPHG